MLKNPFTTLKIIRNFTMSRKIFIPGITGSDLKLLRGLTNDPEFEILTLMFLLTWRLQLAVTLSGTTDVKEIQGLESARFISRNIAQLCRPLAASIAVTRTLGFQAEILASKNENERKEFLKTEVTNLVDNAPPRGVKVLKPGQVNPESLSRHRYGIMASLTGLWQAKPLYEPANVLSGMPAPAVSITDVISIFGEFWISIYGPDSKPKEIFTSENFLTKLKEKLDLNGPLSFNDGIYISTSNILPMEEGLVNSRTAPAEFKKIEVPQGTTDEILLLAGAQVTELAKQSLGKKPKPPVSAPPATPPKRTRRATKKS